MSPHAKSPHTSHARYQSQFLNFLNRQSQRLRDRSDQWLRQLKITSIWGGQLALYPIYALFQAGRLASRQLRSQFQQALQQLRPATEVPADLAIQRLLEAIQPASETRLNDRRNNRLSAKAPQLASLQLSRLTIGDKSPRSPPIYSLSS